MKGRLNRAACNMKDSTKKILIPLLIYKLAFFLLIFFALRFIPIFGGGEYDWNLHWPMDGSPTLATHFSTWDGAHYLLLSESGYAAGSPSCAFYPLWPFLIKVFSHVTWSNHVISGMVLANLLSLVGILFFHHFVTEYHDAETANLSVILLLAFPGALFFSFIYTESLFFLLIILFFLCLFRGNYRGVFLIGFLLPLTKAIGVFCILPLYWHLFSKKETWRTYLAGFGPLLGYASYFLIILYFTGNPFEGFEAQKQYPNQPSISNLFNYRAITEAFFNIGAFHRQMDSFLDRFLFVLFLGSLYWIYRLRKVYVPYALASGAIPAMSTYFFSYTRNIMMTFPLMITLANEFKGRDNRHLFWSIVALSGIIQIYFIIRYINFYWVA
jgi:hypothetical protein